MISSKTEKLLRRLLEGQSTYRPQPDTLEKLREIQFVCFVGASCMGKTTLMDALAAYAPEIYGKTRNFTTRPPRTDDDPKRYYYYEHSDAGLQPLFDRIAAGENLQHNINPYTLTVYGSEIDDYPHRVNLGDIFASSIDGFRQLGFGRLWIFSVVTEPDIWAGRIKERFPIGHHQRAARLREAIDSLTWSLAQHATDHQWIINPPKHIEVAVTSVDSAIRGEKPVEQAEARALAEACLKRAQELLG